MFTFKKIMINNETLLAIEVNYLGHILFNFCTVIRINHVRKKHLSGGLTPYTRKELENLKRVYQESLERMVKEYGSALVDISNGNIISPDEISDEQILGEYQGPLPF